MGLVRGPTRIQGAYTSRNVPSGALRRLAEVATRQHGVVSLEQLRWLGFNKSWIDRRIAAGYLIRVQRSVYAVGHARLSREGYWMAAVLTYGEGTLLSHLSAAAHCGLLRTSAAKIDVSLASHRDVRARKGIRTHHSRLHPSDIGRKDSIPVTSPMRTLLDLADVVAPPRVREAFEQSQRMGLFDRRAVDAVIERSPGRRGLKVVGELIAEGQDTPPDLRSPREQEFLDLIRAAGLPIPQTNVVVEGILVDAYWPEHGLVVELDSYGYHRSKAKFEQDRKNTEQLQNAGLAVRRFSTDRLKEKPNAIVQAVRAELTRRR